MSSGTFDDHNMALRMRNLIESITSTVVKGMRPEPRTAQVVNIDYSTYTADVQLPGDEGLLNVKFPPSLQPRSEGAIVRVSGKPGNYYISSVLSQAAVHAVYEITDAKANLAVNDYITEYAVNASSTVAPTTGWDTATPVRTPGNFIWFRTTVTRNDTTTSTTSPALLTGNDGAQGNPGTPASIVTLTATTQALIVPTAGGPATVPPTSAVTAAAVNTTVPDSTAGWQYSVDGGTFSGTVPPGVARPAASNTVTITGATMTAKTIAVKAIGATGISDTMTVSRIADGAAGSSGGAGADAYAVLLTNENQTFAGTTSTAVAGGTAVSQVIAYRGTVLQSASIGTITGVPTGMTITYQNNPGTAAQFTVSVAATLVLQSGVLTVPVTVGGITFNLTFSWSVAYTGAGGAQGISIVSVTPYWALTATGAGAPAGSTLSTGTPTAPWVTTEPTYTPNFELWRTEKITYSSGSPGYAYTTVAKSSAYNAAVQVGSDLKDYVQSRGVNLVTNGSGYLGNNTNFSLCTYNGTDVPTGATGSFRYSLTQNAVMTDEFLPVDPNLVYELNFDYRQVSGSGNFYSLLAPCDAYGLSIAPQFYMAQANTQTTLATTLSPGATTVTLTSAFRWNNAAGTNTWLRSFIFWNYVDAGGKAWPVNTYSRNWYTDMWADGGVSGNIITLRAPWSGPTIAAGTAVSNGSSGGGYMYIGAVNLAGPSTWTHYSGRTTKGAFPSGTNNSAQFQFPMATAKAKVGFLMNYPTNVSSVQAAANVSLTEVTAGADAAAAAAIAQAAATPDAFAPSSSPTPIVVGSLSYLTARWAAIPNHDTVTYEVHCAPNNATFTCTAATKQGETTATSFTIAEKLADGTFLVKDGSVTYYVRIIAKDANIVSGFNSAAPGTAGSGVLRQAADSDISDGWLYTNAVDALKIHGSFIDADIAILGKIKTAQSGQRMELSNDGLQQFGPDGMSIRVDLPNDPSKTSYIDAIINARGLTVNQGMEVRGQSTFAMGSKTILQTQTVGSTSGPSLGTDYPQSAFARGQWCDPHYEFSLDSAESSGSWRSSNQFFSDAVMHHGNGYWRPPLIANSSGDTRAQYSWYAGTVIAVGGAERHVTAGDFRVPGYVGARDEQYMITSWDDSGLLADGSVAPIKKAERQDGTFSWFWQWKLGRCFSSTGATRAHMVAQGKRNMFFTWPSGEITLSTLAFTDTTVTPSAGKTIASSFFAQDEDFMGITYGSSARMGFQGTDQDVWVIHGTLNNYVFTDAASPVRLPELEFPAMPSIRAIAACGDVTTGAFTRFTVAPATDGPQYYNHTGITWAATSPSVWWGVHTWNDSVGTGHETNASALSSITMKKRARLTVTVTDLPDPAGGRGTTRQPDDVNGFRFYLTRVATPPNPVRTDFVKQTQQPADLALAYGIDAPIFTGSTPPPLTTNFPDQASASIESTASGTGGIPKIKLTGDGYAHVEDLDVGTSVTIGGIGATALKGKAFEQLYYSVRGQAQLLGGGAQIVDTSYNIKWTNRFIATGMGRGLNLSSSGYFNIFMPAIGTVIPGYGGATSKTVATAGILLNAWDVLWYELPYESTGASLDANFRMTSYTSDFTVPNNWVLIAVLNADAPAAVRFATGNIVAAGSAGGEETANTVVTAASGWSVTYQYFRRAGRQVSMQVNVLRTGATITGAASNGNVTDNTMCTMSNQTWAPVVNAPLAGLSSSGLCMAYVNTSGTFVLTGAMGGINGPSPGPAQTVSVGATYST